MKEGQRVKRGQVVGLLGNGGNGGNSSEPHLHFHVSGANDPLISEGLPYVIDSFRSIGQTDGLDEQSGYFDDVSRYEPVPRRFAMPRSDSVVDDGEGAQPPADRWNRRCFGGMP